MLLYRAATIQVVSLPSTLLPHFNKVHRYSQLRNHTMACCRLNNAAVARTHAEEFPMDINRLVYSPRTH